MNNTINIKIVLGISYMLIISIFLWFFLKNFSIQNFNSFDLIKQNRDTLENLKNSNILISILLFFFVVVLWVLLLGFGSPVALIGGFIFGKWLGTLLTLLSLTTGATFLYLISNYFFKNLIKEKFSSKLNFLTNKFKKNELFYFIIYRFIGGIPFFISNILPTIFNVKVRNFFIGSIIGMIPQLFIAVSLGAGLNNIIDQNEDLPTLLEMIIEPDIYIPIISLFIIVLISFFLRKKFLK